MVDTSGMATMAIPSNTVVEMRAPRDISSCDALGEYARERMEEFLWDIGIGNADSPFTPRRMAEKTRDECEAKEMRADCRGVRDRVHKEIDRLIRQDDFHMSGTAFIGRHAGLDAEEACLAGYGLTPEDDEDSLASR